MAHKFFFPSKDTWISSGSLEEYTNFGQDEILELKKVFNPSMNLVTSSRILIQFDYTNISKSIALSSSLSITQPSKAVMEIPSFASYSLRMYEAYGTTDVASEYTIMAHSISESWDEGLGKAHMNPDYTGSTNWHYKAAGWDGDTGRWSDPELTGTGYSSGSGGAEAGSGSNYLTGSGLFEGSQSFAYESPDINMDVSDIVSASIADMGKSGDSLDQPNHGIILKLSGSTETDASGSNTDGTSPSVITHANLKFFSRHTHTIYSPKLEVKWDDCKYDGVGDLSQLTMSGDVENYFYQRHARPEYRETETVKFRFGARKKYIAKTTDSSYGYGVHTTQSYAPSGSCFYSIQDLHTGETIIPFGNFSSMSLDETGHYFKQDLNGFYPDRFYKILLKVDYDDGQEVIYGNNDQFEFKIVR